MWIGGHYSRTLLIHCVKLVIVIIIILSDLIKNLLGHSPSVDLRITNGAIPPPPHPYPTEKLNQLHLPCSRTRHIYK